VMLRVVMGVPKHEVWSREQFSNSNSKACRKTRTVLPEWYRKALIRVPENEWCRKTRLGVLEGYRKATFGVKDGYREARIGMPGYLPKNIAGQIRRYNKQTAP